MGIIGDSVKVAVWLLFRRSHLKLKWLQCTVSLKTHIYMNAVFCICFQEFLGPFEAHPLNSWLRM